MSTATYPPRANLLSDERKNTASIAPNTSAMPTASARFFWMLQRYTARRSVVISIVTVMARP